MTRVAHLLPFDPRAPQIIHVLGESLRVGVPFSIVSWYSVGPYRQKTTNTEGNGHDLNWPSALLDRSTQQILSFQARRGGYLGRPQPSQLRWLR